MASSGSFNTSKYEVRYLTFSWSVQSQSIANNTTTIKWTLKGAGGSTSTWYQSGNFKVVIDGATVYSSSTRIKLYNGTTVASGTRTLTHNNLGNKTFSASAQAGIYTVAVNCTGSGSWALPQIPRYATSNQSLAGKTETSLTMNWSSDSTCDYIWYSSNNGSTWTGIDITDGTSGSYTISGLTANTTYQVKTRVRRKDSQLTTDSAALSVATYSYPYANSMPNFTIGNQLTIGLFNPLGRSVTVNILGADNSQISNDTTSGTSITGYNNSTVQNRLYASIPNSKSGTYKVKVTYGSNVNTNTGGTYSVNESNCLPTIGTVAYLDGDSSVTSITQNNQLIVRNQSKVQFNASGLVGANSATISSCKVVVNGNQYNMSVSGSSASVSNIVIDSSSNVTATFIVTDSRGISSSKDLNVTMLDWSLPTAIITCQRQNNYYSETDILVDADYSSIDSKNTITIKYRYKKVSDTTWGSYSTLSDNVQGTFTIDNNYEWNVQVVVQDAFGSTTYNILVPKGMPIFYVDRLNNSVGFNCFPKDEQSVEVNGVNIERNVMTRSLSANVTDLAVNTYTIVPLNLSNSVGNKLTATNDGGIEIGANVSKILVSGRASIQGSSTTGRRHLRIMKNSYTNNNTIAWSQDDFAASVTEDIVITPTLGDVQEGDVIYLWYYVPNSADAIGGNTYGCRTSMTVEIVG